MRADRLVTHRAAASIAGIGIVLLIVAGGGARPASATPEAVGSSRSGVALRLEDAIRIALRKNLDARDSALELRRARAGETQAWSRFDPALASSLDQRASRTRSATLLAGAESREDETTSYRLSLEQSLSFGARYELAFSGSRFESNSSFATLDPAHASGLEITLEQPLLEGRGSAARADFDVARLGHEAAASRVERAAVLTATRVSTGYWALAEAEEAERTAAASVAVARALLARNRGMADLGLLPDVEVLTADSGLATRRQAHLAARRVLRDTAEDLVFLIHGEDAAERQPLPRPVTAPPPVELAQPVDAYEARGLVLRPDLAAARADVRAAEVRLRAAENALLPQLDLVGGVGTGGTAGRLASALDSLVDTDDTRWNAGLRLTLPIRRRGERAERDAAAAELERLRLALVARENAVRQQVRRAHRAVTFGMERLREAQRARALSEATFAAEQRRLELGLGDTFRTLQAEEDVTRARETESRVRFDLTRSRVELDAAAHDADRLLGAVAGRAP